MITAPIILPRVSLVIQQAVTKLWENYKGKEGWSTQDIIAGYRLFENIVKAEVFVVLDGGKDEEMWLRDQLQSVQSERQTPTGSINLKHCNLHS